MAIQKATNNRSRLQAPNPWKTKARQARVARLKQSRERVFKGLPVPTTLPPLLLKRPAKRKPTTDRSRLRMGGR